MRISSDGTKNWRAHCYETEKSRALDTSGENPDSNHGGVCVIEPPVYCLQGNGIDRADTAGCNGKGWRENESYTLNTVDRPAVAVIENHPADSRVKVNDDGVFQTLSGRMGTDGGNVPMVMNWDGSQISPTLTSNNAGGNQRMPDKNNFNAVITTSHGGFMVNADDSGIAHALEASDHKDPQTVCYGLDRAAFNQGQNALYNFAIDEEKIGTQTAKGPGAVCSTVVRRLTPLECERLQGYPDGWTDIGEWVDSNGKKHKDSDSPRYKALGNSIALPFWEWMAGRMVKNLVDPTMASLFDGIGGFPLVYQRCGCEPVWASEIEEFPIAVTKIRFPEGDEDE